jgi:ferritin
MLSQQMQDALNKQCNAELYSAYLYLSMSAYFQSINFEGFAHWMRLQAQEELEHAMKFYDFVIERGGRAVLGAVDEPTFEWASPLAAFENAYEHEQKVTSLIHNIADLAIKEGDHATNVFLHWFVDEQVEEEAAASAIAQKLQMIGDSMNGLFMLDHRLGER